MLLLEKQVLQESTKGVWWTPSVLICFLVFQVYDTATGQIVRTFNKPNCSNNYSKNLATFNPTDDLVLNDGVLWDVRGNRVIRKFDKFNDFVSGVFHPSGLEIIINSEIVSFYLAKNLFDTEKRGHRLHEMHDLFIWERVRMARVGVRLKARVRAKKKHNNTKKS